MDTIPLALAIFAKREQADAAVSELKDTGFHPDEIVLARQLSREEVRESASTTEATGVLASLTRFFKDQLGLDTLAKQIEADFEAGRTIVRVEAGLRVDEAMAILERHGGYNRDTRMQMEQASSRARVAPPPARQGFPSDTGGNSSGRHDHRGHS